MTDQFVAQNVAFSFLEKLEQKFLNLGSKISEIKGNKTEILQENTIKKQMVYDLQSEITLARSFNSCCQEKYESELKILEDKLIEFERFSLERKVLKERLKAQNKQIESEYNAKIQLKKEIELYSQELNEKLSLLKNDKIQRESQIDNMNKKIAEKEINVKELETTCKLQTQQFQNIKNSFLNSKTKKSIISSNKKTLTNKNQKKVSQKNLNDNINHTASNEKLRENTNEKFGINSKKIVKTHLRYNKSSENIMSNEKIEIEEDFVDQKKNLLETLQKKQIEQTRLKNKEKHSFTKTDELSKNIEKIRFIHEKDMSSKKQKLTRMNALKNQNRQLVSKMNTHLDDQKQMSNLYMDTLYYKYWINEAERNIKQKGFEKSILNREKEYGFLSNKLEEMTNRLEIITSTSNNKRQLISSNRDHSNINNYTPKKYNYQNECEVLDVDLNQFKFKSNCNSVRNDLLYVDKSSPQNFYAEESAYMNNIMPYEQDLVDVNYQSNQGESPEQMQMITQKQSYPNSIRKVESINSSEDEVLIREVIIDKEAISESIMPASSDKCQKYEYLKKNGSELRKASSLSNLMSNKVKNVREDSKSLKKLEKKVMKSSDIFSNKNYWGNTLDESENQENNENLALQDKKNEILKFVEKMEANMNIESDKNTDGNDKKGTLYERFTHTESFLKRSDTETIEIDINHINERLNMLSRNIKEYVYEGLGTDDKLKNKTYTFE